MNDTFKISDRRIKILEAVYELSEKNERNLAPVSEIINVLGKSHLYIRKELSKLKKHGYVINPAFGYWRLTPKGVEVVSEVGREEIRERIREQTQTACVQ